MTQAVFAKRVTYSRSAIANVETGRQRAPRSFWKLCDTVLDADGDLLAAFDRCAAAAGTYRPGLTQGFRAAALGNVTGADDSEGREGTLLLPDDEERLLLAARTPSRVDRRVVESLSVILAAQRTNEDVVGSAPMLGPVQAQLVEIENMLAESRGDVRVPLLQAAAQWAQFAAWLSISVQRWDEAARYLDRAGEWAAESGMPIMPATVLSFRGYLAFLTGRVGPAIGLAAAARRDVHVHVAQRAYDTLEEARGLAVVGDVAAATARLDEAADLSAAADDPEAEQLPPWMYYHTRPFRLMKSGSVHRYLGMTSQAHTEQAISDLTAGLEGLGPNRDAEWAGEFLRHLCLAYAQAGSPDLAAHTALEAAQIASTTRSVALTKSVRQLHDLLAGRWPSHPAMTELADALH